jgi:hypothetical protein
MYEKLFKMMQDAERNFEISISICFVHGGESGYITVSGEMDVDNEFSSLQEAEQILNDMFSM